MKKILTISFILLGLTNLAFAYGELGFDAGTLNSQTMRDFRTHEAVTRAKAKNSAIVSTKTAPPTQEQVTASNIKNVSFVNNVAVPSSELAAVVRDKINQPMTPENIAAMRRDLMRYYQNRGFFSAVPTMVSQDTQTGEVVFDVKEGGRNSIIIEN